jgi:hypothetical protein
LIVSSDARRVAVFFYGLFMDEDLLRTKGAEPTHVERAVLEDWALRIGQRATLVPAKGSRVYGILMELTQTEIEQLYADPSVRAYRPEAVLARRGDGTAVPALCFNLLEPPRPEERNPEYATKLRALARRLELPAVYVESLT